jgi:hypothetical protein
MPFRLRIRATDKIEHNGTLLASKVMFAHHEPEGLVSDYALHWGIETLFGIFKSLGEPRTLG